MNSVNSAVFSVSFDLQTTEVPGVIDELLDAARVRGASDLHLSLIHI